MPLLLVLQPVGLAQQQPSTPPDSEQLAKQLSNPISSLVSVPFQFNWEQDVGPFEETRFILDLQPVMPFSVNDIVEAVPAQRQRRLGSTSR